MTRRLCQASEHPPRRSRRWPWCSGCFAGQHPTLTAALRFTHASLFRPSPLLLSLPHLVLEGCVINSASLFFPETFFASLLCCSRTSISSSMHEPWTPQCGFSPPCRQRSSLTCLVPGVRPPRFPPQCAVPPPQGTPPSLTQALTRDRDLTWATHLSWIFLGII